MTQLPYALAAALLFGSLQAQDITITANALLPIQPSAGLPGMTTGALRPAGPLTQLGFLDPTVQAGASLAKATVYWQISDSPSRAGFTLNSNLQVTDAAPAFAATQTCDVLVSLQASSPVTVSFRITSAGELAPGAVVAQHRVDLNNDGTFEVTGTGTWGSAVALGTQPVLVRLQLDVSQTGAGTSWQGSSIELEPLNALAIAPIFQGCDPMDFYLAPTFADSGISMTGFFQLSPIAVAVIGLGFQPLQLPNSSNPIPCTLVPTPDLLIPMFANEPVYLAVPPAVRPVAFWAQGVTPVPAGFGTSVAFSVLAF